MLDLYTKDLATRLKHIQEKVDEAKHQLALLRSKRKAIVARSVKPTSSGVNPQTESNRDD